MISLIFVVVEASASKRASQTSKAVAQSFPFGGTSFFKKEKRKIFLFNKNKKKEIEIEWRIKNKIVHSKNEFGLS